MLFGIDDDVAGLELALLTEREQLVKRVGVDLGAVVQVLGVSRGLYHECVSSVVGEQEEGILFAVYFFDHNTILFVI